MELKRRYILLVIFFLSIGAIASDYPIIFVHGHKSEARPEGSNEDPNDKSLGGWGTWYPRDYDGNFDYPTAMTKIADIHYKGYRYGLRTDGSPAKFCDKNTTLQSTPDSKRIYNFSYHRPDGGRGVIGSNGELECLYVTAKDGRVGKKSEIPQSQWKYGYDYGSNNPLSGDKWAVNLANFIDKVLAATGASRVDIIVHSMGGLVARSSIKYYGCASKVRKLLTVGTPNHYFDWSFGEWWWGAVSDDPIWMRCGEDWEMSADRAEGDENITFKDVNTGIEKPFTEFLDIEPLEGISTIAGNKGWDVPGHPNDGVVEVTQVHLNSAQFNKVIYASHSYKGIPEEALTTCSFTTLFIKKWIIDDIVTEGIMDVSPALMDIDGDGKQEIFLACDDGDGDGKGRVYAYDSDWNMLWSKKVQGDIGANPCISDLDNDGNWELVVATDDGYLYVFNAENGSNFGSWPKSNVECSYSSPACGDVDGDDYKEIVIGTLSGIRTYKYDGSSYVENWSTCTFESGITLVDFDKNGDLDVLCMAHGYEKPKLIFDPGKNASIKMNPEESQLNPKSTLFNWATLTVGDIDNDGWVEMISVETYKIGDMFENTVHCWELREYNNWWGFNEEWYDSDWSNFSMLSSPVIADVDNDGQGEVIVAGNYYQSVAPFELILKCYEHDGIVKWEKHTLESSNNPYSSPSLGDIDDDDKLEVVIGSNAGHLYSFNVEDGTPTNFPIKSTLGMIASSPLIADIDNNGKTDIIVTSEDHFVYCWEGGSCPDGVIEWGKFHRDNYNSGKYLKGGEIRTWASRNESCIKIFWDDYANSEDGYQVYRKLSDQYSLLGFTKDNWFADHSVERGTRYYYYIQAMKGEYPSKKSEKDFFAPYCNQPTNFEAQIYQDSMVKLTWQDNSVFNIGYEIIREDFNSNQVSWSVGDIDSTIDDSVDLDPSYLAYIYWVRAFDAEGHTSHCADPETVVVDTTTPDTTPPYVNITSPEGQYRVFYNGYRINVEWDASDDCGIYYQTLYFLGGSIDLYGDVRSIEVDIWTQDEGSEWKIKLTSMDSVGNIGKDSTNNFVVIDPSQADIPLYWEDRNGNWRVTIYTDSLQPPWYRRFDRVYKGEGNNWERIDCGLCEIWHDPDSLNKGETRSYLVCKEFSDHFSHFSDTITVHRPYDIHPCPVLYTFTGNSFEPDNSLLPASEFTHQLTRDYYILKKKPQVKDGKYQFKIIEGLDNTYIDLIKLRIIEHPKDVKVGALPKGEVIAFRPSSLPYLTIDKEEKEGEVLKEVRGLKGWRDLKEGKDLMKGKAWKDSLVTEGSGYYYGEKGDYLDVLFNEKGDYLYSILAKPKDPIGIRPGNKEMDVIYSRMNGSDILLPCTDSIIRFIPQDSLCRIDYVSKVVRLPDSLIREKEASAVDLPKELAKEDKEYYHLSPGDTLEFSFEAPDLNALSNRSYCLEVIGYYLPVAETIESKGPEEKEPEEIVYASYIKPASSLITGNLLLRASSNKRRLVKVEVIDLVGRILKRKNIRLSRGEEIVNLGGFDSGIYFIKIFDNKDKVYKVTVIR